MRNPYGSTQKHLMVDDDKHLLEEVSIVCVCTVTFEKSMGTLKMLDDSFTSVDIVVAESSK